MAVSLSRARRPLFRAIPAHQAPAGSRWSACGAGADL